MNIVAMVKNTRRVCWLTITDPNKIELAGKSESDRWVLHFDDKYVGVSEKTYERIREIQRVS